VISNGLNFHVLIHAHLRSNGRIVAIVAHEKQI
jgi:hypothetical protein